MRVPDNAPPPVLPEPIEPLRVVSPTPESTDLPPYQPAQVPDRIPPSPERPKKQRPYYPPLGLGLTPSQPPANIPEIRKPSPTPDLPKRPEGTFHIYNTRFGRAVHHLAQTVSMERYDHHIAELYIHPEAGNQPSLKKLFKGPDKEIWDCSNANKWVILLPNGVGKYRPENEHIKGTVTI